MSMNRSGSRWRMVKRRAGSSDAVQEPVPSMSFFKLPVGGETSARIEQESSGPLGPQRSRSWAPSPRSPTAPTVGARSGIRTSVGISKSSWSCFANTQLMPGVSWTALLPGARTQPVSSSMFFSTNGRCVKIGSVGSVRARCRLHAVAGCSAAAAEPPRRKMAMTERRRDTGRSWARRGVTRRAVLRSAAVGGAALAGVPLARAVTQAAPAESAGYVPRPNATRYVLGVGRTSINPDGARPVSAVLGNGRLPGPEIRVREGDLLRVLVENRLPDSPTSIHWHGLLDPAAMDGVPDVSNVPIAPGRMYVYEYPIRQSGTYWYHSHFGFQEQQGCYGAFIIEPVHEPLHTEHDAVVLLGDWLHRSPEEVYAELRGGKQSMGGMKPGGGQEGGTKPGEAPQGGMNPGGAQQGGMKMEAGAADLSDVKYDAFLINGRGPDDPWTLSARPGERVRLRLIDGGSSTYFRVRLDGHPLEITHADGLAVQPVTVDHLLIGMGETYDAVVKITAPGSYTLHAVAMDGSGQALGVLHTPGVAPQPNRAMPSFDGRALSYADLRAP